MMRRLAKWMYFNVLNWSFLGEFPTLKKCVVIVVPHTHWLDFPLGIVVRKIVGVQINFIGKKSLFKAPYGWFFRWMGGAPIDRSTSNNTVEAVAQLFHQREEFRFALAPEGTRKKVTALKTGFYRIAKEAKVPIVMVAFDFGRKQVKFSQPFWTSDDMNDDFKKVGQFFAGVKGRVPEYSFDGDA